MVDAVPGPEVQRWDPRSPQVLDDQVAAYDALRRRCPVAHSESLHWSVFRHADVVQALLDPGTFGNEVSTHLSVPNGMDPPRHTAYRHLIEPYFGPAALAAFEPVARRIADEMIDRLRPGEIEWMDGFARECALRMLSGVMQWPASLHEPLREWIRSNQAATLAQDRAALADLAFEFDGHIRAQLAACRADASRDDPTARLLRERVEGRPLEDAEIVSIVRNWTVGELSTMAACFGILAGFVASHPRLQDEWRAQPQRLPAAIDEVLRIDPPLIANRRIVRSAIELGRHRFEPGDRVSLIWASANRDEAVFGDPDEFRADRDPGLNLLYGAGIHVCPGAPLARLQLRLVLDRLLARTRAIEPSGAAVKARYPTGGFSSLPLRVALA
jgi:cytochrome P450